MPRDLPRLSTCREKLFTCLASILHHSQENQSSQWRDSRGGKRKKKITITVRVLASLESQSVPLRRGNCWEWMAELSLEGGKPYKSSQAPPDHLTPPLADFWLGVGGNWRSLSLLLVGKSQKGQRKQGAVMSHANTGPHSPSPGFHLAFHQRRGHLCSKRLQTCWMYTWATYFSVTHQLPEK